MQSKFFMKALLLLTLVLAFLIPITFRNSTFTPKNVYSVEQFFTPNIFPSNYEQYSKGNFSGFECSKYNLSVFLSENTSIVAGNLTVDYYNNDPVNFSQIPFHLYTSGMEYVTRPGFIEIINVTTLDNPKTQLPFNVFSDQQLMWINLTTDLEPQERVSFCISFNTTLPDGGIDRANEHGTDLDETKIFKFASCYPMPCVYDELDEWNIDPYLHVGDPFYFDMAYYDFKINVPKEMVVAATGEIIEKVLDGERMIYRFNPKYPIREVTFSASRHFIIESQMVNGVNISTYFLPSSYSLWHNWGLEVATQSFTLYNNTLGNYPYDTFNVVEEHTQHGGMEYPLQVYITSTPEELDPKYPEYVLELIIAHETAHQWFYNMLGVDEVDWGFLDEGIVVWITDYFRDIRHPNWYLFEPYRFLNTVREYNLTDGLPNKINQSVYDAIDPDIYHHTAYIKAPTILEHLRRTVLHDDFILSLRLFFQSHYFEFATLLDLKDACETIYGHSLDWYFFPWFNNAYLPKYEFSQLDYDVATNILSITVIDLNEHLHEYSVSQKIKLSIYSNYLDLEYINNEWINGTTTISIPIENRPNRVLLSYDYNVLVQISKKRVDKLETYQINIINSQTFIPSYNLILFLAFLSISLLALIFQTIQKNKR